MDSPDSTAPPPIDPRPIEAGARPTKAYTPGQVAGAAFLGSPIAGCLLIASNYSLFGRPEAWRTTVTWGVIGTVALFLLAIFVLPEGTPDSIVPAVYTAVLYQFAKTAHGAEIDAHLAAGGQRHSHWRVAGIGLACLLGIAVVGIALIFGFALT